MIGAELVRLLTESVVLWECVIVLPGRSALIETSSEETGTAPELQLPAVSQSPPLGLIQETAGAIRGSSHSRKGLQKKLRQSFLEPRKRRDSRYLKPSLPFHNRNISSLPSTFNKARTIRAPRPDGGHYGHRVTILEASFSYAPWRPKP
jgi:hypothetical protein